MNRRPAAMNEPKELTAANSLEMYNVMPNYIFINVARQLLNLH